MSNVNPPRNLRKEIIHIFPLCLLGRAGVHMKDCEKFYLPVLRM